MLDRDKVTAFINDEQSLTTPWFGQLMAGPQMMAYLLQVDYWLRL
jgi:asparagine synthase (glutamine-hydrolysing)